MDTVKRNKRQYAWKKENVERIDLLFEKGTKDQINSVRGSMSVSEYVRIAVKEKLERER